MSGILLPEIVIYNTLEAIVRMLRKDLEDNTGHDELTILYKILGIDEEGKPIQMNLYNYFKQAKKMMLVPDNLSVNFGYNQKVASKISMHILLPNEQGNSEIGSGEGYMEDDILDINEQKVETQPYFTQMFECTYQILITSNNSSEVNVVYNILKSMILMLTEHLELMGIRIPSLSGNDIMMQDDIIPVPVFHKVINLSFRYEHNVPQLVRRKVMKNFYASIRAIESENISVVIDGDSQQQV